MRNVLSAIAGYVTLFVVVFGTFSLAFLLLGAERAYEPGAYDVSMVWILVSLVLSFVAAVVGGYVCLRIARDQRAVKMLAALALVAGLLMAGGEMMAERQDEARPAAVGVMEAMSKAMQPPWVGFVITFIHVAGVLVGGRLVKGEAG